MKEEREKPSAKAATMQRTLKLERVFKSSADCLEDKSANRGFAQVQKCAKEIGTARRPLRDQSGSEMKVCL